MRIVEIDARTREGVAYGVQECAKQRIGRVLVPCSFTSPRWCFFFWITWIARMRASAAHS